MQSQLAVTPMRFRRYLYNRINWQRQMLGLVGPRGIGKSTMFLQYIKEHQAEAKMLYVSADHTYFASHSLAELADEFVREGGRHLLVDEIHKYANWSRELKQIHDGHPDLRVAVTGSSVLDITKGEADLSRRMLIYHLQGLSFREYLGLFEKIEVPPFSLQEIIEGKAVIEGVHHPIEHFQKYLTHGYYPFGQDQNFQGIVNQVIGQTMETDIPQFANMSPATGRKLKRLLAVIAESVPFKPKMDTLAQVIGVSRNTLPDYLLYMEKAGMIGQLRDSTGGIRGLGKVEKVYLDNPNLAYILGNRNVDTGNVRETFFYNQMRVNNEVIASRISDFEIDGKTFEVGGWKKGKRQIADAAEGYVVRDDTEYASGNVIPLWAFGLNY